jgi:hypothetical protein
VVIIDQVYPSRPQLDNEQKTLSPSVAFGPQYATAHV